MVPALDGALPSGTHWLSEQVFAFSQSHGVLGETGASYPAGPTPAAQHPASALDSLAAALL